MPAALVNVQVVTMQVVTRPQPKGGIADSKPVQDGEIEKPKHEELQVRYFNPIPQMMATVRSQLHEAQSRNDKITNLS